MIKGLRFKRASMIRLSDIQKFVSGKRKKKVENEPETYLELLENSPVGYYIIQDNQFRFVNKTWCEVLGYAHHEIVDKLNPLDLVYGEDRKTIAEFFGTFKHSSGPAEIQFRIVKKDGNLLWTKMLGGSSVYQGRPAISGNFIEYHGDKLLTEQLQQSEERLRMALEVTQIGIWDWDVEKDTWYASPAYYTMLGYEPVEEEGNRMQWIERVHPEDREMVREKITEVLTRYKKEYKYMARMLHANGSYRWQYVAGYIVRLNSLGDMTRMVGIRRDIHDYKLAEEKLKQSEGRLRTLIDTIPDLIWLKDPDGMYLQCNQRFETLYGVPEKEIVGTTDYHYVSEDQADFFRQKDKEAIIAGKPVAHEAEVIFAGGHVEVLEIIKTPIFEKDQVLLGVLGIGRIITEKKKAEIELDNYRRHLEKLVQERTEELNRSNAELQAMNEMLLLQKKQLQTALDDLNRTQNQLIQSEKMASLGVLSAGIAHEINNPLNFILGGSAGLEHYLKERPKEDLTEIDPFLKIINEGVQRASTIVKSLNHYSRREDLPKSNCDLHAVLDNCLVMLRNPLKNKAEVVRHYMDQPALILANEGKLHQAFLNILTNAEQAIDGFGLITITTKSEEQHLVIIIDDTGTGMDNAIQEKIFDPFFTTKEPGMGSGLGLSITYNIIHEHGGSIEFESELKVGTKVTVRLPVT